jgi:hypothetical protein
VEIALPRNPISAALLAAAPHDAAPPHVGGADVPAAKTVLPPNPLRLSPEGAYAHVVKTAEIPGANGQVIGTHTDHSTPDPRVGHLAPGGLEQLNQETEAASAAGNADYNRRSGTTGGVAVGMKPEDLKTILRLARAHPDLAGVIPSLTNPVEIVRGAVHGGEQLAHGVGEVAHGKLAHGAEDVGLGGLGVASVLPFARGAKAVDEAAAAAREARAAEGVAHEADAPQSIRPKSLGGGLPHRTADEAAQHLDQLTARAKAEGFGSTVGGKGNPPLLEKGVATDETGGELGRQVREAMPKAPAIRAAQKAGFSEERALRVRAAVEAGIKAGGGHAGHLAEKHYLADALPREFFGDLKHLTPTDVDKLKRQIDKAPLQFFEQHRAKDAIDNAVDRGVVPTKGEQALLERVFGRVASEPGVEHEQSMKDNVVGLLNVPRAIRSSGDISAGFRQGLVVAVTHPGIFARQFSKQLKYFGSEDYYQQAMDAIHSDPLYPLMEKYGLPLTDIGESAKTGASVGNREEAYIGGNLAERLPLGVGKTVRASDRAFTGFLNGARAEMFDQLVHKAALMGHDLNDPHVGESIAQFIGTATGRGVVPKALESHLVTLNAALFSPRLIASRLNMLSPVYYAKLDPFARGEAVAAARNLVATMGVVMYAARLGGAKVNFDPRSSNFAKIKIGNTRIDITGGFSQYVRLIAQEMTREAISSAGSVEHITSPFDANVGARGTISDLDNLTKFGRSKAAPVPGMAWDIGSGKDYIGRPIKVGHELWSNAPFVAQDWYDGRQVGGTKRAFEAAFLSAIGLSVQSYKDKPQGRPTPEGQNAGLPPLPPLPALPSLPALPKMP